MSHLGIAKLGQKSYLDALYSISHVFLTSSWERLTITLQMVGHAESHTKNMSKPIKMIMGSNLMGLIRYLWHSRYGISA